jgi:hypothetical protein
MPLTRRILFTRAAAARTTRSAASRLAGRPQEQVNCVAAKVTAGKGWRPLANLQRFLPVAAQRENPAGRSGAAVADDFRRRMRYPAA